MGKGQEGSGDLRRGTASERRPLLPTCGFKRLRQRDAAQPEDLEVEQRGLFDGEAVGSEGERDAHGARLSEL